MNYKTKDELDLCQICHTGMKCSNILHAGKHWNTDDNWHTRGIDPELEESK